MVFVGIDSEFQKAFEADAKEDDWLIVSAYASIDVMFWGNTLKINGEKRI